MCVVLGGLVDVLVGIYRWERWAERCRRVGSKFEELARETVVPFSQTR